MPIGYGIYDIIDGIKGLGHMCITQSEFRPGSDYTSFLCIGILK